jgi:hypothetical protein
MKHVKKLDQLFEMAKDFPVGSFVKVVATRPVGYNSGRWSDYYIKQEAGISNDDGFFYIKIENSGRLWLEGKMVFPNCLTSEVNRYYKYRATVKGVARPGDEFKILEPQMSKIQEMMDNEKQFLMDGDESYITDAEGKNIKVKSGRYFIKGVNYGLTINMKEPVVYLKSRSGNYFCCTLASLEGAEDEDSPESKKVIAEWFSKNLKADVTWDESRDRYVIETYEINGGGFEAGPFINKETANEYLEKIKDSIKDTHVLTLGTDDEVDLSKIKIVKREGYYSTRRTLDEMVKIAEKIGVKVSLKELMGKKKGNIQAKKLGLLD